MDNIVIAWATIDIEDIILYILNGLKSRYNALKIVIHTKLTPISLEDMYWLLIGEEINLAIQLEKENNYIQSYVTMHVRKGKNNNTITKTKTESEWLKTHREGSQQILLHAKFVKKEDT